MSIGTAINMSHSAYKRNNTWQKTFELNATAAQAKTLGYFIKNELAYYQALSHMLGIRMRAFPEDFVQVSANTRKLWLFAAQFTVNSNKLKNQPRKTWPQQVENCWTAVYNNKNQWNMSSGAESVMNILATACHLHPDVRRNMAEEILNQVCHQADILHAAQKTEELRTPVQTLPQHEWSTKRHVQIPRHLVKVTYNAMANRSEITIPYCHDPLLLNEQNIQDSRWDILVVSKVDPDYNNTENLQISLRTTRDRYLIKYRDETKKSWAQSRTITPSLK
tara:strand:+ start:11028 stop:11861 length:834 start_codon:yes stop_codon:yes gene_type:complete